MRKLTADQRAKVMKFAKRLVENSKMVGKKIIKEISSGLIVKGSTQLDNNKIKDYLETSDHYAEWDARNHYWLFPEDEGTYDELESELEDIFTELGIDARYEGIFESKKITNKKAIKESNNYTMISALREALDDLLMKTEMLIDSEYGKSSHKDFKRSWYNISETFEKTFKNIQRSLMVK